MAIDNKEYKQKMEEIEREMHLESRKADLNRARSFSIGTCFGGITELGMKTNDGKYIWAALNPSEVVELVHQLSAAVGCHAGLLPREDFAQWRNWQVTEEEKLHLAGHPAFPKALMPEHDAVGRRLKHEKDKQLGLPLGVKPVEEDIELVDKLAERVLQKLESRPAEPEPPTLNLEDDSDSE